MGPLLGTRLDVRDLLLSTDLAHCGGRSGAGMGSQDRHDPLGQDLTHCEGQEETADSGTCFLFADPTLGDPSLARERTRHSA